MSRNTTSARILNRVMKGIHYVAKVVLDTPFNWRRTLIGSENFIRSQGLATYNAFPRMPLSAFIAKEGIANPIEIRDWLHDHSVEYNLFGRFYFFDERQYDNFMTYIGLNFQFFDSASCVHFRMRWNTELLDAA